MAASTIESPAGAVGYRPGATLSYGTEMRRQFARRRTQITLGFMVALPLIILIAFEFGGNSRQDSGNERGQFAALATIATSGGLNFALFTLLVSASFLLIVVVALFCGDTVASEASLGVAALPAGDPGAAGALLGTKLLAALTYCAVALALLVATALAAGTLRYGWHPLSSNVSDDIAATPALWRLLGIVAYIAVSLLVVAGLAFLLSVSTDAPLGAVGGAVLLQILSSILDQITALGSIRDYLPTHYGQAWLGLLSTPIQTTDMVKGTIVSLGYATIFFGLAWLRFSRKDVVS